MAYVPCHGQQREIPIVWQDGMLRSWQMENGRPTKNSLDLHVEKTFSIALSARNNFVSNGEIHLWDLGNRRRRNHILDGSEAYRVVFSPNSDYLASYGRSCDITI
jgi:WD40 repeat protein